MFFLDTEFYIPVETLLDPVFPGFHVFTWLHEVLEFHYFKLATAEYKVTGSNLITESFSLLGDSEGQTLAGGTNDVLEIDEHTLRRLRSQIDHRRTILHRPDQCFKH